MRLLCFSGNGWEMEDSRLSCLVVFFTGVSLFLFFHFFFPRSGFVLNRHTGRKQPPETPNLHTFRPTFRHNAPPSTIKV